jgi:hypothetical protein
MNFFFKNEKADKKQKKCKTLSSQNLKSLSLREHQRTTLECGRARIKTDTHAHTHAKERDLERTV